MTTRWPAGCLYAASSITVHQHASRRAICLVYTSTPVRRYAQGREDKPRFATPADASVAKTSIADPVQSALATVESNANTDPINPPRSTRPPPLSVPERGQDQSLAGYWWGIGRAYGTFYKDGVKAVYYNYRASRLLRERIKEEQGAKDVTDAVARQLISRSEFQLLARNRHDIGKLPVFGLLVAIFGEWLPLIVPFIPNAVPGTCRIPKQVAQMREAAEQRRRVSFRHGVQEPLGEQIAESKVVSSEEKAEMGIQWTMAFSKDDRSSLLRQLRDDQLHHLSSVLGLHSRLWDRVQLSPPAFLLRGAIGRRFEYLSQDDFLMIQTSSDPVARLQPDELHIACEERGLDIMGQKEQALREKLRWWIQHQNEDEGKGNAMMIMLFRRPNAWK